MEFKFDGIEKAVFSPKKDDQSAGPTRSGQGPMTMMIGMDDQDYGDPNIIQLPTNAIKKHRKEFSALQEAMRKDPNAMVQSMLDARNASMPGGGNGPKMKIDIKVGPQAVVNNPIELPEK